MEATTSTSTIQKKMFTYARDIALDKLNKKIDKKLAKQQIRKKEHENVSYQRCSENSDFIPTSSEYTSSSSSSPSDMVHSNDTLATTSNSSIAIENSDAAQKLPNKNVEGIGQSVASIDSSGQDEDYQTADEDEDEQLTVKKDVLQTVR